MSRINARSLAVIKQHLLEVVYISPHCGAVATILGLTGKVAAVDRAALGDYQHCTYLLEVFGCIARFESRLRLLALFV
jgi:hypothetical protein